MDNISKHRLLTLILLWCSYTYCHLTGENVAELFNRIAIVSMENIVMKELATLRKLELTHQVVERSSLIRKLIGN